jgi:hypothetical protein
MKLKDLISLVDWLSHVVIWTEDSVEDGEPAFDGVVMDIPWIYMDMKIGRPRGETEEPIRISQEENSHEPIMVINLLTREETKNIDKDYTF